MTKQAEKVYPFTCGGSGAALCTLGLAALFLSGRIQVWQIFALTALSAAFGSIQMPAYSALVAATIHTCQLGRANGLLQFGRALADILAASGRGLALGRDAGLRCCSS